MLTRLVKVQLALFSGLTLIVLITLGWHYLRLPALAGVGRYTLYAELPNSGGLYATANVTYRGSAIGKVTAVEATRHGARATMSIDSRYKVPVDATANVHSVSAVGEQYLDLVSASRPGQYLSNGQVIVNSTVPADIGPVLDATNRALAALPNDKISTLLIETSRAVGGSGPALRRLADSTQSVVKAINDNLKSIDDLIDNATPILDSQVASGDDIDTWSRNLDVIAAQTAQRDQDFRAILQQGAPTAASVDAVFRGVGQSLPQTMANLEVVLDMLKRYHAGVEQALVLLPQIASIGQTLTAPFPKAAPLDFSLAINQPPPCMTGFLPASQWRSTADTTSAPLPAGTYCKIPQDFPANVVRGARNYPCADVPGKRAATPRECRSNKPYIPAGTNPWYGDPNQILNCPAPGARCDQPVKPGYVIPAPSIDNGMNPLPADRLPQPLLPRSDPPSRPGRGSVTCNGQQPNPCVYEPLSAPSVLYDAFRGELTGGPGGTTYTVSNSDMTGDEGWKHMLGGQH